ncbi:hypothetical protein ACP51X_004379 [Vibrio vulnificus]
MVIDIPTGEEFINMSNSLLQSSWGTLVSLLETLEVNREYSVDGQFSHRFVDHSKPELMSAFTLVQQAIEFFLKGRIAEISPFILIANDNRNWPKRASQEDISFQEFRTIDAQDLIKVHNTFAETRLDDSFNQWFNQMRNVRNKIIHSISSESIKPNDLANAILMAHEYIFGPHQWIASRLNYQTKLPQNDLNAVGKDEIKGFLHHDIHKELSLVIKSLTPGQVKHFFGFDKKAKAMECPKCESIFWQTGFYDPEHWNALHINTFIRSEENESYRYNCFVCQYSTYVYKASCTDCRQVTLVTDSSECLNCG